MCCCGRSRPARLERDRHGCRDRRAGRGAHRGRRPDHRAGHTLYDIVRKLRDGAQIEIETPGGAYGGRNEMVLRSGRSTFTLACLPPETTPSLGRRAAPSFRAAGHRIAHADRPHPLRDLDRGDTVLSERHLPARDEEQRHAGRPRRGDRRAPPRPVRDDRARGGRRHAGVIVPRKTVLELRKLVDEGDEEVRIDSARPRSALRSARPN